MSRSAASLSEPKGLPLQERLLWKTRDLALLLGCSRQHVLDMLADYVIPAPVADLGSGHAWRAREMLDWIDAGCPRRDRWTWKPSRLVKLDDLLDLLRRQAVGLDEEIRDLEARKAKGEQAVTAGLAR